MQKIFRILGCLGAAAVLSPAVAINAVDSGHRYQSGFHDATNQNFLVGLLGPNLIRNFFVFDLTSVSGTVTAVTLNLEQPLGGFASSGTEIYQLFNVSSTIAALTAAGVSGSGSTIYDDLGDGTSYGQVSITGASNGTTVSIVFNSAGIAAVQGALGGQLAIGGMLQDLSGAPPQYSFNSVGLRELNVTLSSGGTTGGGTTGGGTTGGGTTGGDTGGGSTVPEPGTVAMLGGALLAMGLVRAKKA